MKHRHLHLAAFGMTVLAFSTAPLAAAAPDSGSAAGAPAPKPVEQQPLEQKTVKQLPDGRLLLSARDATIHGTRLRYEPEKSTLGYWFNADDWASWRIEIVRPGKFFVDLTQSCGTDDAGSHYTVEVEDQKLKDKVQDTGSFRFFRLRRIGTLEFTKPGAYTISVHALDKPNRAVMDLRAIALTPPKPEKSAPSKPEPAKAAAPIPSKSSSSSPDAAKPDAAKPDAAK